MTLDGIRYLSLADLSARSGLSRKSLWRLIRSRQLRAKMVRGAWHVRESTWSAWCAEEDSVVR